MHSEMAREKHENCQWISNIAIRRQDILTKKKLALQLQLRWYTAVFTWTAITYASPFLSLALWQVFALSLVILCALFGNSTLVFHFRKQSIHLYKSHSRSFTICQYSPDVVNWSGFMIVKSLWNRLECDCFYCIMIHFTGAVNNCLYLQPQNLVFICAVFYSCLMHTSIQTSIACITNSWY